jgi:hypothetical protein
MIFKLPKVQNKYKGTKKKNIYLILTALAASFGSTTNHPMLFASESHNNKPMKVLGDLCLIKTLFPFSPFSPSIILPE